MIHVIGDSHVVALLRAYKADQRAFGPMQFSQAGSARHILDAPFYREEADGVRLVGPMGEQLNRLRDVDRLTPDRTWALSWGMHSAKFFRDIMWATSAPAQMNLPDRHALSAAVVQAMIRSELRHFLDFVDALSATRINFLIIAAPPLRADHYALSNERTRAVRLEASRLYRAWLTEQLRLRQIPILAPPAQAVGPDGLLKPDFYHASPEDQHHANAEYGALVLQDLAALAA